MQFFNDCHTLDEVKAEYKRLAKMHHPDKGGDTATMQTINREFAFISAKLAKEKGGTTEETEREIRFSEEYRKVIEQLINLEGITIELVGFWIWVTGETRAVKSELKAAGLFFASKKQAWYYRAEEYKVRRGGKLSFDEIKNKYGSTTINSTQQKRGEKAKKEELTK